MAIDLYIQPDGTIRKSKNYPGEYSDTDTIPVKNGDLSPFNIWFMDGNNIPQLKTSGAYVQISMKSVGNYDDPLIAAGSTVTDPLDSELPYVVNVSLDTDELDTLLLINGDSSDDVASVDVLFEVSFSDSGGGGGATDWVTSQTVYATVHNNLTGPGDTFPSRNPRWREYIFSEIDLSVIANHFVAIHAGYTFTVFDAFSVIDDAALNSGASSNIAFGFSDDGAALTTEVSNNMDTNGTARMVECSVQPTPTAQGGSTSHVYLEVRTGSSSTNTASFRLVGWETPT